MSRPSGSFLLAGTVLTRAFSAILLKVTHALVAYQMLACGHHVCALGVSARIERVYHLLAIDTVCLVALLKVAQRLVKVGRNFIGFRVCDTRVAAVAEQSQSKQRFQDRSVESASTPLADGHINEFFTPLDDVVVFGSFVLGEQDFSASGLWFWKIENFAGTTETDCAEEGL